MSLFHLWPCPISIPILFHLPGLVSCSSPGAVWHSKKQPLPSSCPFESDAQSHPPAKRARRSCETEDRPASVPPDPADFLQQNQIELGNIEEVGVKFDDKSIRKIS
jgi:hypothetical protein